MTLNSHLKNLRNEIIVLAPLKLKRGDQVFIKVPIIEEFFPNTIIDNDEAPKPFLTCIRREELKTLLILRKVKCKL